ncbi:MAG: TlpA disulfide reductase family protein, partial [Planctomycetota bacterium]
MKLSGVRLIDAGNPRWVLQREAAKRRLSPVRTVKHGPAVHLRTGDAVRCHVVGLDDRGLIIDSPLTETRRIPHGQIKAAQLVVNARLPRLDAETQRRLLTLPRMQQNSAPAHLLILTGGDVLRGTATAMNADEIQLEMRLSPRTIPRDRVAAIVWLHEDEWNGTSSSTGSDRPAPEPRKGAPDLLAVQVVSNAGPRYTFFAESCSGGAIHGSSDVLPDVHAPIEDADQLFFGGFIERASRSLPYHQWRLASAKLPRFAQEREGEAPADLPADAVDDANLIGRPAPDVRLPMLGDEQEFDLADLRGECVVLDFWATWCGPCAQGMRVVDSVVSEFADRGVRLVAINIAESPEQIRLTLEHRGLEVPVALDRDSVASTRYHVAAIPQTVVIDAEG